MWAFEEVISVILRPSAELIVSSLWPLAIEFSIARTFIISTWSRATSKSIGLTTTSTMSQAHIAQ